MNSRKRQRRCGRKKPMTTGKKWVTVVAMALVFGLIAGGNHVWCQRGGKLSGGKRQFVGSGRTDPDNKQRFKLLFF